MKSRIALALSLFVSSFALAAGTDWPFPEGPKPPAGPNPVYDLGTCKIISHGLLVIPGESKNPVDSSHFGETLSLSYTIFDHDAVLTLDMVGTTGSGKPNTRKIETKLAVSMGSDYQSFSYVAPNAADELRSFTADMEVTERTKNDVATKAILSTLAKTKAKDRAGKEFIRTNTARYLCDLKAP